MKLDEMIFRLGSDSNRYRVQDVQLWQQRADVTPHTMHTCVCVLSSLLTRLVPVRVCVSACPASPPFARLQLERYFDLATGGSKQYVMHRLRVLARDGYLGRFRWEGGGSWKGNDWSTERPNDAMVSINSSIIHITRVEWSGVEWGGLVVLLAVVVVVVQPLC